MPKLLITFFLFGLSFGWGPCIASCGPLLISYFAASRKTIRQSIVAYCVFSLSRIAVYMLLGISVFYIAQTLSRYAQVIAIVSGVFLILIGALIAVGKMADFSWCKPLHKCFIEKDTKTFVVFGLIAGIIPCAPFISVASYIGLTAKTLAHGIIYSAAFGLGTILSPLILLSVGAGFIPRILGKAQRLHAIFNFVCGVVIIVLGVMMLMRA